MIGIENTLSAVDLRSLLASATTRNIDKVVTEIEDHIDTIDDHNNDALPCSDIVEISKEKYQESFPTIAQVYHKPSSTLVTVKNPKFDDIPHLLSDSNEPLIITSIRKSEVTGGQTFGREYTVDSGDKNTICIDYTWDGDGNTPIPSRIVDHLFSIRAALIDRKNALHKICERYVATSHHNNIMYVCGLGLGI